MNIYIKILIISLVFLCISGVHGVNETDINSTDAKTFADLDSAIHQTSDGETINITDNHKFTENTDHNLDSGINITKNITINGNGKYIDGSNSARALFIDSYCNVIINNLVFKNGYSNASGGAIFLNDHSNLTLIDCIFQDNTVYNSDGGAINTRTSTNLNVYGCTFENNRAIRQSDLEWSKFKAGMGGAICLRIDSNLRINNSIFKKNVAYLSTILVVSYDDVKYKLSTLLVNNSIFDDNNVYECGIIYLDEKGVAEILNSQFTNNKNNHSGGVLEIDTCISCTIGNCTFDENQGTSGGAIKIKVYGTKNTANVVIYGCDFIKNSVTKYGGAIFAEYATLNISNCSFRQNTASKQGGAIYTTYGTLKFTDCKFTSNKATDGGALYMDSNLVTLSGLSFAQNSATSKGGAIYCLMENVKFSNIKYSSNTAGYATSVYGIYNVKIKHYTYKSNSIKLKVKIASLWKMSASKKIRIKITGSNSYTSKWVKTNANGIATFIVPLNLKYGKYNVAVEMDVGVCKIKSFTKVKDTANMYYSKKVKKSSKIKVTVKNKASKKLIKNTKFKVKVYTGKKYNIYTFKTNSKGILKIPTSKLNRSKHKIIISLSNSNYEISNRLYVKII